MSIQLAREGVARIGTPPRVLLEEARHDRIEKLVVRAVVTDPEGRYGLLGRLPKLHRGGIDELVGGGVEMGERLRQALKREVGEELNLGIYGKAPFLYSFDNVSKEGLLERTFVFNATVKGQFSPKIEKRTHGALWLVHYDGLSGTNPSTGKPYQIEAGTAEVLRLHHELQLAMV